MPGCGAGVTDHTHSRHRGVPIAARVTNHTPSPHCCRTNRGMCYATHGTLHSWRANHSRFVRLRAASARERQQRSPRWSEYEHKCGCQADQIRQRSENGHRSKLRAKPNRQRSENDPGSRAADPPSRTPSPVPRRHLSIPPRRHPQPQIEAQDQQRPSCPQVEPLRTITISVLPVFNRTGSLVIRAAATMIRKGSSMINPGVRVRLGPRMQQRQAYLGHPIL